MQKVFDELNSLDKRCYTKFALSEDILMEHAANAMASYISENYSYKKSILIVCGSGNNGADGITLARLLYKRYKIKLYLPFGIKSDMSKIQFKRIQLLEIKQIEKIKKADIIVDCLFGTGLNKNLNEQSIQIIEKLNLKKAIKIACDIPSGINCLGQVTTLAFKADVTITMGALKTSLFLDRAKDYVGKIIVANLGVQRKIYETNTNTYLLDKKDLILPFRNTSNANKGDFGHLNVICGSKIGASIIASKAGFAFGAGIVSMISDTKVDIPAYIMQSTSISHNCTAIAIGMGLGSYDKEQLKKILTSDIKKVIDADLFYEKEILFVLNQELVLTPHPKEFCSLLKLCEIDNIDIKTLQNNRFFYVKRFCAKYPRIVLVLKGANVLIAQNQNIYINTFGNQILAKGGSGDVLSGLIASLLAQGYDALYSALNASLAHTLASANYKKNNYALNPLDLIKEVKKL